MKKNFLPGQSSAALQDFSAYWIVLHTNKSELLTLQFP